ncbi:Flowering time control protein FPA [Capsicum chinense]|nr:Flowering time control protein FPA [Capsicum chinense]
MIRNFSLVLFRIVEKALCAKESLQGKFSNDPKLTVEYSNCSPYVMHAPDIPTRPLGSNVPSGPVTVSQAYDSIISVEATISPRRKHRSGHDESPRFMYLPLLASASLSSSCYDWIPGVINCAYRKRLHKLTDHYPDAAVGFNIFSFLPDTENDYASYTESLRYLSSNDRAWVAEFAEGTTLLLVPTSNFLKKVLKVEGQTRIYGVVLKYVHHIPRWHILATRV